MSGDVPRLKQAYYDAQIVDFLKEAPQTILGHLAENHSHELDPAQRMAWIRQVKLLQRELAGVTDGWIAFEFVIPRMGKRADAILVLDSIIFVVEFKIGAKDFDASAIDQAIDYCLDLKNFHAGSHSRPLVPVVIATRASNRPGQLPLWPDDIAKPVLTNGTALLKLLQLEAGRFHTQEKFNSSEWMTSGYKPTPTIIEAAQALYASHRVNEITRSDAGAQNLTKTAQRLSEIIEKAKIEGYKAICFVTGVPGAGKTLAGLNLVTEHTDSDRKDQAVFLSGNDPLVEVLREALAQDEWTRFKQAGKKVKLSVCRQKVKLFIQNIHHFRDANLTDLKPPVEHVAVFDEAQRAWDAEHLSRFMARKKGLHDFVESEPSFLIDVFDRHEDWCVIICLVGGGQEINAGEAGLAEWFSAISLRHRNWKVFSSNQLNQVEYRWEKNLAAIADGLDCKVEPNLHLAVSIRSFRAEKLSEFVNILISGRSAAAAKIYEEIKLVYPIYLARDLGAAKNWLRARARGTERSGLVAYSGASRLKSEGVNVQSKIDAPQWFLNRKSDVRSSFYLEDPATEFDIQGLELDWVGVCWEANFRPYHGGWAHYNFHGTEWQKIKNPRRQAYLANAYRVLLTRARQGMVIYVPRGDLGDRTRPPDQYDCYRELFRRLRHSSA